MIDRDLLVKTNNNSWLRGLLLALIYSLGLVGVVGSGGGGGGGGSDSPTTAAPRPISGGGVKGPLANAIVTVYVFNAARPGFKGAVAGSGTTDAAASITGLSLPQPLTPPYIMEFTSDTGTTDITTGLAPVISTLRTVLTQALIDSGEQVYATPLTTMATDIAVANAADTNGIPGIQADEFETALAVGASQVVSTLGFGLDRSVDIFDTPPLVDSTTDTTEEQAAVAAYRAAVEAVTAIAYQIDQQTAGGDADGVLAELAADLADGGGIDGSAGSEINSNTLQVLEQDPATLIIPNTTPPQTVANVQAILVSETTITGTTTPTTELDTGGSITTETEPAETDPDIDNDGVLNADDAYPNDATADTDSDGDGAPDVVYSSRNPDVVDAGSSRADTDDDNDGWPDGADDYPLDSTRFLDPALDRDGDTVINGDDNCALTSNSDQADTDGDGRGDACSNDSDGDGVDDSVDNCPLLANPGQEDLDGDLTGDVCDANIDGDAADNASDAFPLDPDETTDTDGDGLGDSIADSDDDNDGVDDVADTGVAPAGAPSAGVACSLLRDCDGDGAFDNVDIDPVNPLNSVNYAPVANDDSAGADEDSATFAIAVTANDTDNDGNPNDSVSLVSIGTFDSALGTAALSGNNIDYTPAPNASGSDTFDYTVTDGTVFATGSVTVVIDPVNDAPVAFDDVATTNEDNAVTTGNVLANDTDVEGDTLSVVAGDPVASFGTVVNNGDGTFTYTPNPNSDLDDSFTYTVSDGNGGSDDGVVSITVNAVNDPPIGVDDNLTTDEDTPGTTVNVLLNDSDGGDGGALSVLPGNPTAANGSVVNNGDGTFTYTPNLDFNGSDSFTYTVSDGTDTDIATVDVIVNPVNDPPLGVDDSLITDEDTPGTTVNVLLNDSDGGDGGALSVVAFDAISVEGGVVSDNGNGSFTYIPAANFNGSDSFAYTLSDGADTDAATVNVTVIPVNDPPLGVDDSLTTDEDTPGTTVNVLLNDSDGGDGGALSVLPGNPTAANGSVVNNGDGTFTYTPNLDFNGSDSFTYTLSDGADTDAATVNVTVDPINDLPVGNPDAFNAAVSSPTVIDVLANDADIDGDALTVTAVSTGSRGGNIVISNGGSTITFTDTTGTEGSETFTYTVSDGIAQVGGINVTMTVIANAPPVAGDDSLTTDEDIAGTTVNLLLNDSDGGDGGALSITAFDATSVQGGTVSDSGGGTFTYTPAADFNGSDSFTYTLSDTFGTDIGTVNITVNPVNDPPVATDDAATTDEDNAVTTGNVLTNDTDPEGDALSVVAGNPSASNGTVVNHGDGTFTYTPNANFNGGDSFAYTVSDGNGGLDGGIVLITVNPVNDNPVAVDDVESVTVDNVLLTGDVLANDSDVDGDILSVAAGNPTASNGSVVNNGNGTFTYTPNTGFVGSDSFVYTAVDGNGGGDTGTVTITVNPLGTAAVMETLLDPAQGGGVGAVESFTEGLVQFEYWKDEYDPVNGRLLFFDLAYDYSTQTFVDSSSPEDLWLTPAGTWEQPTSFDVTTANAGDGSMIAQVTTPSGAAGSFRLRANTRGITGDLISAYVDGNWQNQMLNPAATFGAGALEVTSYSFETQADTYILAVETGCEFDNPTRWATLGSANCNGVNLDATGNTDTNYATSLAQIQSVSPWPDSDTFDISGLTAISMSFNGFNNTQLLAELVTGGNTVNYWVRDFSAATGADHMTLALSVPNGYQALTVVGVDMIRVDVPPSLQSLFPDLAEEPLPQIFAVESGFVRGGVVSEAGTLELDTGLLNGIALDQVLANFDPPAAPDVTDLIGTWVADTPSFINGDPNVFHVFPSLHYESSGTCDVDGSTGMEYGTLSINPDGTFTATASVNGRGPCSVESTGLVGATVAVTGDVLSVNIPGSGTFTYSRLKGTLNPLVGSWLIGDITVGGDGGHALLTFLDDNTFTFSEDCGAEGAGMEYGIYAWDQGGTGFLSGSVSIDTTGDCGLNEASLGSTLPGDWVFSVTGDTLTISIPLEGDFVFTRHSPALVPIVPAISYQTTILSPLPKTLYHVWYDDFPNERWNITQMDYAANGTVVRTPPDSNGDPTGTPSVESFQFINGILELSSGSYLRGMTQDPVTGAYRSCVRDSYEALSDCTGPGEEWQFDNLTAATNFKNSLNNSPAFSGTPVTAATVFNVNGGVHGTDVGEYEPTPGNFVGTPGYFSIEVSGSSVSDREFLLIDGVWTELPPDVDIALTATGWTAGVDERLDTAIIPLGTTATLQTLQGGNPLRQLTVGLSEMDIAGQNMLPFIGTEELVRFMINGSFSAGAKVYETTVTSDLDYYFIYNDGTDCNDGFGGNFNGNCNVARVRSLNRATGQLAPINTAATSASFVGDNTVAVEIGFNGFTGSALVAVFASGGVLELWEANFFVSDIATQTGAGTWMSQPISGELLIFYDLPQSYNDAYQLEIDGPVFLSLFNGYMRFGSQDEVAGTNFVEYLFNPIALQDIRDRITPP